MDAAARAQRAYEVSRPQHHNQELVTQSGVCAEGLDLGDHASADASRNCDCLLQQMDEQVSALIYFCSDDTVKNPAASQQSRTWYVFLFWIGNSRCLHL
jgi:hypothetical protein